MALTPSVWYCRDNATISAITFTASQSTTTLTTTGNPALAVGMVVWSSGSTYLGVVTGGSGNSWTMSNSATVASTTMVAFAGMSAGSIGWSSVAVWAPSTSYTVGQLVRQKNIASVFTASTSGSSTTLTIASITSGGVAPNQSLFWAGSSTTPIIISSLGTSTGGTGTVTMSSAQTISSQLMVSTLTPGNERVFICIVAGTSGSTEPNWTLTKGAKTTDNTATWIEVTGQPALCGDTTNSGTWLGSTAVALGVVIVEASNVHVCTTAGTTAATGSKPTFATTAGTTTTDNTATWTCLGAASGFAAWAAPSPRLSSMLSTTWAAAGDKIFLGDDHAEVQPTAINITSANGTPASPQYVVSVNHATVPPTTSTWLAGASITTVGPLALTLMNSTSVGIEFYGVTASAGTGATNVGLTVSAAKLTLDTCTLAKNGTSGSIASLTLGTSINTTDVLVSGCSFKFGATTDRIQINARVRFQGISTLLASGSVTPTGLISATNGPTFEVSGCDFSALGSGTFVTVTNGAGQILLSGCKLGSTTVLASSPGAGFLLDAINCDSAATQYQRARYAYAGTLTTETTVVRTGGASVQGTAVSDKIVTTSNCSWAAPFVSIPLGNVNSTTGANVTVTVYGLAPAGLPTNDQIWLEVEYPGSASSSLASIVSTTKANAMATAASVTSDSSTWGGAGTAFKLVLTLSSPQPQLAGMILGRIKIGKASGTFYVDPVLYLS